jgi:catechol 2,3-dioxygenase-like lactoylglutathione lyase family enzyme
MAEERTLELFAGNRVSDYERAKDWYVRLLGSEPSFLPHATEAVWQLAEHASVFIVEEAAGAGGAMHTIIVDDLDERVAAVAARGIEPDETETYSNGVRKVIYRDPDGNEIGFGGVPS